MYLFVQSVICATNQFPGTESSARAECIPVGRCDEMSCPTEDRFLQKGTRNSLQEIVEINEVDIESSIPM